ncbi:MAG: uroporphyrinogen decarboxylase family protein, partial [Clostridia bacterium]|nr:uroporphyrinogen decarboxylase family protein [Clostridia bacterium]
FFFFTDTYKAFLDKWFTIIPRREGYNAHWDLLHKGTVVLRDDSAMNLSPDLYKEFAMPYDAELLRYYDGGVVHFCGRGDHYISLLASVDKLYGINMSQPHLNDMEKIFDATVDKGVFIYGFPSQYVDTIEKHEGGSQGRILV